MRGFLADYSVDLEVYDYWVWRYYPEWIDWYRSQQSQAGVDPSADPAPQQQQGMLPIPIFCMYRSEPCSNQAAACVAWPSQGLPGSLRGGGGGGGRVEGAAEGRGQGVAVGRQLQNALLGMLLAWWGFQWWPRVAQI